MKKLLSLFTALPLVAILMFSTFVFAGAGDLVIEGKNVEVSPKGISYGASYFPDYNETDQGAIGNGRSTKDYIDAISTDGATLVFQHNSGGAITTYTFGTSEEIPSNINVVIEKGAILSIATAQTLTINGPPEIGLYKVFSGDGHINLGKGTVEAIIPQWWGASPSATAAVNKAAIQAAADMCDRMGGGKIFLPEGSYDLASSIVVNTDVDFKFFWFGGAGANTKINWTGTGGAIEIAKDGTGMNNFAEIRLSNFRIDGGTITANRHGIVLKESVGQLGIFEKLWLRNLDHGMDCESLVLVNIYRDLKIRNCNSGIYLTGNNNTSFVENSDIMSCIDYGVKLFSTISNCTITNCRIDNNGTGIYSYIVHGLNIAGCRFESNVTSGIELTGSDTTNITQVTKIDSCYFTTNGSQAIKHHYAKHTNIDSCYFKNNTISLNVSYTWAVKAWENAFISWGVNQSTDATIVNTPEYITSWEQERRHTAQTNKAIDLSGAGGEIVVIHPYRDIHLIRAIFLYTEASSGDAGIQLRLGIEADIDSLYLGNSEINKALWYSKDDVIDAKSWAARKINAGDTLRLNYAGGKVGAGEVLCIIEYAYEF